MYTDKNSHTHTHKTITYEDYPELVQGDCKGLYMQLFTHIILTPYSQIQTQEHIIYEYFN